MFSPVAFPFSISPLSPSLFFYFTQAYVAPTDVDLTAGVQWLPLSSFSSLSDPQSTDGPIHSSLSSSSLVGGRLERRDASAPSSSLLQRPYGPLLAQVFQPCSMYLQYTRYKAGSQEVRNPGLWIIRR